MHYIIDVDSSDIRRKNRGFLLHKLKELTSVIMLLLGEETVQRCRQDDKEEVGGQDHTMTPD